MDGRVAVMAPSVGEAIPDIERSPSELSLFLFSASTWNGHRIHYDRDYARAEGHDDVLVHGSLQGNWLVQTVRNWQPHADLVQLSFRNIAPAYVNQAFTVGGVVESVEQLDDRIQIECKLWVNGPTRTTTTGTAVIVIRLGSGQ